MAERIAGCDLGKASASFVITRGDEDGVVTIESSDYQSHDGKPLELFRRWYRDNDVASCAALGATGIYADDLIAPVFVLPEDSCQEAALEGDASLRGPLNLVSIGARGYGVLSRRELGAGGSGYSYQYLENDKCSSGAGENIQKMAARFGLTIEQADITRELGIVLDGEAASALQLDEEQVWLNGARASVCPQSGRWRRAECAQSRSRYQAPD